jgi:hypothetical protein
MYFNRKSNKGFKRYCYSCKDIARLCTIPVSQVYNDIKYKRLLPESLKDVIKYINNKLKK